MRGRKGKIILLSALTGAVILGILLINILFNNPDGSVYKGENAAIQTVETGNSVDSESTESGEVSGNAEQATGNDEEAVQGTEGKSEEVQEKTTGNENIDSKGRGESLDNAAQGTDEAGKESTAKTQGQDQNKTLAPGKPGSGNSKQTPAKGGSKAESAMTDADFQKIREAVNNLGEVVTRTANVKISPMMLSLSGLGPDVDAMKEAQAAFDKQKVEFNRLADGIKAAEIKGSNMETVNAINSELSRLSSVLDRKLADLKAAKKALDVETVGALLNDIAGIFEDAEGQIEKLNAVLK